MAANPGLAAIGSAVAEAQQRLAGASWYKYKGNIMLSAYQVTPEIKPVTLPEGKRPSFLGHALGYGFLLYMMGGFWSFTRDPAQISAHMGMSLLIGVIVGSPLGLLICWVHLERARELYALEQASAIATKATRDAIAILKTCEEEASSIGQSLREADGWIAHARGEYEACAFGPFWDSVERAAEHLASCNISAHRLRTEARRYESLLVNKRHNFPAKTITRPVPDPTNTLDSFRAVVRKGQTDYKFAIIWEHRATRQAIIAGFGTWGEALNGLSTVVSNSFANLQEDLSMELNRVVEEQRKSLKVLRAQDHKLDNIQRHREPPLIGD